MKLLACVVSLMAIYTCCQLDGSLYLVSQGTRVLLIVAMLLRRDSTVRKVGVHRFS